MRTTLITSLLTTALLGVVGCAENAGMQDSSDRYTIPEATPYAAPSMRGQATGITGDPSGAGGIDLSGEARPGMWDASRDAKIEQPAAAPSPYQNLPPGSVAEPAAPAQSKPAPATNTPPTAPNSGNTVTH